MGQLSLMPRLRFRKEIALRPDGTFSLRFSLPDGKQIIPVKAVSADSLDERVITPVVTKETR